ncbi:ATP-binding protein [uncultured Alistipes sp.]|jgi:Predicted ATPase|uniref:ATP-binding protein n=1 Tax=uncultured Alistipes sp. TaxID=538949 RepID=UPI0025EA6ED5|nr:ATP-binding protein [uncultured Alistipes sp.]
MKQLLNKATYIADVQNVSGTTVAANLNINYVTGETFVNGEGYKIGQVGSFVKIPQGYENLIGIVTQIGANAVPEKLHDSQPYGNRWMTIQLVGESNRSGQFERGISQYPIIGDEVHIVTESDLKSIYGNDGFASFVKAGTVSGAESIPALLDINKLLVRHSAIVGSTGTGKSTTVAGLLTTLSDPTNYPSSRILVLDIHGEYNRTFNGIANIYKIGSPPESRPDEWKSLNVPYWAMTFDEFVDLAFGSISENDKAQIGELVLKLKKKSFNDSITSYPYLNESKITVDTPLPFSIKRLWLHLHRLVFSTHTVQGSGQKFCDIDTAFDRTKTTEAFTQNTNGDPINIGNAERIVSPTYEPQVSAKVFLSGQSLNIRRPVELLRSKLNDPRYDFIFNPGQEYSPDLDGKIENDIDSLLKDWIGDKNISILDLSGIPNDILNTIIGALLKIIYEAIFWARNLSQGGKQRPLLIVMEEAHNYLKDLTGPAPEIVQRIVKEGRKYGIGAMIVSQRPSEINQTILSQCGTIISLRLSNSTDRSHIVNAASDSLAGLMAMLPILKTGEAIIIGESVKMPMRAYITPPLEERRPDSLDPVVVSYDRDEEIGWKTPHTSRNEDYEKVIEAWRLQNPNI